MQVILAGLPSDNLQDRRVWRPSKVGAAGVSQATGKPRRAHSIATSALWALSTAVTTKSGFMVRQASFEVKA